MTRQSRLLCFLLITSLCLLRKFTSANKMLVNDKITALWKTDCLRALYLKVTNNRGVVNFDKRSAGTVFQNSSCNPV